MQPGKIINNGVKNIKALATLIEEQSIELDFQYYQQMLPVTNPVLVLSETRSMFKNTIHLPIIAEDSNFNQVEAKVKEVLKDSETLEQMRFVIIALTLYSETTLEEFEISPEVAQYA